MNIHRRLHRTRRRKHGAIWEDLGDRRYWIMHYVSIKSNILVYMLRYRIIISAISALSSNPSSLLPYPLPSQPRGSKRASKEALGKHETHQFEFKAEKRKGRENGDQCFPSIINSDSSVRSGDELRGPMKLARRHRGTLASSLALAIKLRNFGHAAGSYARALIHISVQRRPPASVKPLSSADGRYR
jgi:hypothetical protein